MSAGRKVTRAALLVAVALLLVSCGKPEKSALNETTTTSTVAVSTSTPTSTSPSTPGDPAADAAAEIDLILADIDQTLSAIDAVPADESDPGQ